MGLQLYIKKRFSYLRQDCLFLSDGNHLLQSVLGMSYCCRWTRQTQNVSYVPIYQFRVCLAKIAGFNIHELDYIGDQDVLVCLCLRY